MPRNTSLLRFPTGMEMTKARPYQELKALKERNPNIDIKVMVDWTSPASTGDFFASKMYSRLKVTWKKKYCPMEQILEFSRFFLQARRKSDSRQSFCGGWRKDDYGRNEYRK